MHIESFVLGICKIFAKSLQIKDLNICQIPVCKTFDTTVVIFSTHLQKYLNWNEDEIDYILTFFKIDGRNKIRCIS